MIITATVLRVNPTNFLVRDASNGQEISVHFANTDGLRAGDTVQITYSGMMTHSIPPQITATSVILTSRPRPPQPQPPRPQPQPPRPQPQPQPPCCQPQTLRAIVLQIRRGSLIVRSANNQRQITVIYPHAHHFCIGQWVNVQYESDVSPFASEINATDVTPVC